MTAFSPPLSVGRAVPKEESEDACDFNIICHHRCPHCCPRWREVSLVALGSLCHLVDFPVRGSARTPAAAHRGAARALWAVAAKLSVDSSPLSAPAGEGPSFCFPSWSSLKDLWCCCRTEIGSGISYAVCIFQSENEPKFTGPAEATRC